MNEFNQKLEELSNTIARTTIDGLIAVHTALEEAGITQSDLDKLVAESQAQTAQKRVKNEAWYEQQRTRHEQRFRRY